MTDSFEAAILSRIKDTLNWHECLKRCSPAFAKRFIMEKLHAHNVIGDADVKWLLGTLNLREV